MPRKPKVQRTPEEKWQIVLEGLKSGNVAETCPSTRLHLRCTTAGKMKSKKEPRLRLGGEAQPRVPTKSRPSTSSNWSVRSVVRTCKSRY